MHTYDVVILGAGPAGLAAAISAKTKGADVLIIEREEKLGGILKQCIHDGFGLVRFKERLTGPEYAARYIKMVEDLEIAIMISTYVNKVQKSGDFFQLTLINSEKGAYEISTSTIVLANGCRERTAKQVAIHGTRPAGVYTAGTAQYFVNIMGYLPCTKCVILGSGDIGLIMARRLTLEGAEVIGVFEAKATPSGLTRNLVQCLEDFGIPLHLSHTITRIIGDDRVEAVEICKVDESMKPIEGTAEIIPCDGVILSVGLIPENEIAEAMNITIDNRTKGPFVDQSFMTLEPGVFSCGNALHVNDLVDYVSESGELAGEHAASYAKVKSSRALIPITYNSQDFLYVVPQYIDIESPDKLPIVYLRSKNIIENANIVVKADDKVIFSKTYPALKPPEMERLQLDLKDIALHSKSKLEILIGERS